jgi:YD repeat-containing protein
MAQLPQIPTALQFVGDLIGGGLGTPQTLRVDWGSATSFAPVYVGYADLGSNDADKASTAWTISFWQYDAQGRLVGKKVATKGAWVSRTTLTYT